MCGIIGFISKKNLKTDFYKEKFNIYHNKLFHRGPDFQEKININVTELEINLGFSRLAIQDLSLEGNKIFRNENYIILFNGEIYNFNELKSQNLSNEKFETKTDTEVLFKLFIKYGENFINFIEGIFSIAVIDIKKSEIHLFRDFTGVKPLYYLINDDGFFFSSEAWFLYSISNKQLDYQALSYYLELGFSPIDQTLIKNVCKVSPGEKISYNFSNSTINKDYFFKLNYKEDSKKIININEVQDDLTKAIKKNLISDTKIGIFLSGGVDSSLILLLSKNMGVEIEAFTSFFLPENKYKKFNTDYYYAKRVCDENNIKLNKVVIDENDESTKKELLNFLSNLDEPLPNLNILNSYLQAKSAKDIGCKVILTGDGADEIFGGYKRYRFAYYANKFKYLSLINKKIKNFNTLKKNQIPSFFYQKISNSFKEKIFSSDIKFFRKDYFFNYFLPEENSLKIINYFDLKYWLPEESNYKLDRSLMANSIEGRVPFQDITIVNKYFNVPLKKKINFFNEKIFLKNISILPDYIRKRKKIGWLSPESIFIRSYLNNFIKDTFDEKTIKSQNIFNYGELINMYKAHLSGGYFKNEIILILIFQIWYNQVLKS
jgi:asparagine synthase (glutamine-hydrolysing)